MDVDSLRSAKNEGLTLARVSYMFPSGNPGVTNVTLRIRAGERIALMGANGSGKSTILRLASGLITPSLGDVHRVPVAYVAQDPHTNIVGETVDEDVRFGAMLQKEHGSSLEQSIEMALDRVGMSRYRHRAMSSLSGGEVQRVALAAAIVSGAKLWVLDEPTSHLPRGEAGAFWTQLMAVSRTLGVGLLYATHHPQEVRSADRVFGLHRGRVALVGRPTSVLRRPRLVTSLGIRIDLSQALGPLVLEETSVLTSPDNPMDNFDLDEKVARALCCAFDR